MNKCITYNHHSLPTLISCMVKHTNQENNSANCISFLFFISSNSFAFHRHEIAAQWCGGLGKQQSSSLQHFKRFF